MVPHITFIVGASYGAGTYAMSGKAFNNRFTFLWPTAKIAVMGPEQMAGVMSIVRKAKAKRDGKKFVKVDILVTTGAEDGVLVDRDDAQIVGVLPQYLQLSHVGLVQLALRVFHLQRNLRFFYFCFSKH